MLTAFLILGIAIFVFLAGGHKNPNAIYSPNDLKAAAVTVDKLNGGSQVELISLRPFPSSDFVCYTKSEPEKIKLAWAHDSLLIITHPRETEFSKKNKSSFYFGKTVKIEYRWY